MIQIRDDIRGGVGIAIETDGPWIFVDAATDIQDGERQPLTARFGLGFA